MSQTGVYLYGFAIPDQVRGFTHPGHDEIGAVSVLEVENLAVIVSPVCPAVFELAISADPPDPQWIVPRAVHHERVLEAVLARSPVLPTRFGCVFASEPALEAVTRQHLEPIGRFLSEVANQEEWTLKAFLDEKQAVEALLQTDPTLSERFRKLPAAPGARYFLEKKLREEAHSRAIRAGKVATLRLHQAIDQTGVGVRTLSSRGDEPSGPPLLLKLALLIPRGKLVDIVGAAEQAAAASVPLVVETSGPLPPYHFCPSLGEPPR
jgi:hypothetical protein